MSEDRLGVTPRTVQLPTHTRHRERTTCGNPIDTLHQRLPRIAGVVDSGRDRDQATGCAELRDHAVRDPESRRDAIDPRRGGAGVSQAGKQEVDAPAHDRLQCGPMVGEPNATAVPKHAPLPFQAVDHGQQVGVLKPDAPSATMARRPGSRRRPHRREQRVQTDVRLERFPTVETAERGQDPTLRGARYRRLGVDGAGHQIGAHAIRRRGAPCR